MKHIKLLLFTFAILLIAPSFNSCASAEKAAKERRNLMMPQTGDLVRNSSKYKAPKKYKTAKTKKYKK